MNEAISLEGFNPLLTEAVKNDKAVKNLSQTTVLLANLLIELSIHMEEEAFDPLKERVLDFMALADEVFKAITPVEEVKATPVEDIPQVSVSNDPAAKKLDPSVEAIMDALDVGVRQEAAGALGITPPKNTPKEIVRESVRNALKGTCDEDIVTAIRAGTSFNDIKHAIQAMFPHTLADYELAVGFVEHWRKA